MHIRDAIKAAAEKLAAAGIENPNHDSRILLSHTLDFSVEKIIGYPENLVSEKHFKKYWQLIKRRAKHEPVAKIIGKKEFWGREFFVNQHVLDPRPDSETLIEAVLEYLTFSYPASGGRLGGEWSENKDHPHPNPPPQAGEGNLRIIDLGTGTGCLLLTLICELNNATGIGVDISDAALKIARKNANNLGVRKRAKFKKSNWFEKISGKFDLIISNPPYIRKNAIKNLSDDVKKYDPIMALDGGEDGLEPYKKIISEVHNFLKPDGLVCFEFGKGQAKTISKILQKNKFEILNIYKDLAGIERCILARKSA